MKSPAWFILIYQCPSADSQLLLAAGLRNLDRLVIQADQSDRDHFVIVEADNEVSALAVHELVMTIDPHAELVDTHEGPGSSPRRRLQRAASLRSVG